MEVHWSITFGEALTVFTLAVGALSIFFGTRNDVQLMKADIHGIHEKIAMLNSSFSAVGHILTQVAVQDNRLDRLEADVRELKHGEGMVIPFKSHYEVP